MPSYERSGFPLVSIVVVVFQSLAELETLLENLRSRDRTDVEVIVIDGGSTDGTVDLLEHSADVVDYWRSERDSGIYDAMNKGIQAARGAYVLHLNAGDTLLHMPLEVLRACLQEDVDVASFPVLIDNASIFRPRRGFRSRIENVWHHQGTFYRRQTHLQYDTAYRVYGDFDLNQRMQRADCSVRLFSEVIATHSTGGISSALSLTPAHCSEIWRTVRRNAGLLYVPLAFVKLHAYILLQSFYAKRKETA